MGSDYNGEYDDDCDPAQVSCSRRRLARKQHRCCECRGTIQPKSSYAIQTFIYDGTVSRFKTCDDCESLRSELQRNPEYQRYRFYMQDLPVILERRGIESDINYFNECSRARGGREIALPNPFVI